MQQQPRKPNTTIWGLIVLALFIWIAATHHDSPTANTTTAEATPGDIWTAAPTTAPDVCGPALSYANQASSDLNAHDYSGAYHNASSGLSKNAGCSDEDKHLINQGFLLSMKAMAELHLSQGDSRTDFNQANMVLQECVTRPGLYGTSTGASCETQEQYNIRAQTNADLNQ